MLPGGKRGSEGETEHDAAMRHLEEQTGITKADCEEYLLDVPISLLYQHPQRMVQGILCTR